MEGVIDHPEGRAAVEIGANGNETGGGADVVGAGAGGGMENPVPWRE